MIRAAGFWTLLFWLTLIPGLEAQGDRENRGNRARREFGTLSVKIPGRLGFVRIHDMDADGIQDLVYAAVDGGRRELGYFRGLALGGFEKTPAHRLRLKPDVILVSMGDLDPTPGVEFVLFNYTSVFVYCPSVQEEDRRYRRLFRETFFYSFPDPDGVHFWPHVLDLDGDGLTDICVPVWGGFVLRFQSRPEGGTSAFERRSLIPAWIDQGVGVRPEEGGRRLNVSISLGGERRGRNPTSSIPPVEGYMVESVRRMSCPVLVDENNDRRLDLLLLEGQRLKVWRQDENQIFSRLPAVNKDVSKVLALTPMWAPRGNLLHADLDGDGSLDFLVRQEVKNALRTRLLLFMGGVSALARSPRRIFVLNGLTATPRFKDVNGDQRLDLLVPTYRLDLLKRARQAVVESLDMTLHVFLNRKKKGYAPRPDYSRTESIRTDRLAVAGVEPMIYLDGDFNRDRRADLLILDGDGNLKIFLSGKTKGGLFTSGGAFTFQTRAAVSLPVEVPVSIRLFDQDGDGLSEVLLLYEERITLCGWGVGKERGR